MTFRQIDKDFRPDAVILCNGTYPTADIPLAVLRSARFVCCCDGAAAGYISKGHVPDAIVGDGDSLPADIREKYSDILHIVSEQEYNDMTKSTLFCKALGHRNIAYVGATGGREDHTIGNVSLLDMYMTELGLNPVMITDRGWFVPAEGTNSFETHKGQQISIFNLTCSKIEGRGFVWHTYAYRSWWQGTLNEASGDSVTLDTDGRMIVYFTY